MNKKIDILEHKIGRLDIQLLQSLLAVANSPTLSSAALSLNIPQPTMSLQIKRLEERTGCELFEPGRRGKPMRLSSMGERLVVHAEQILSAHNDAIMCIKSVDVEGSLSIGIPTLMGLVPFGCQLKRFKDIYQGVSLRIVFGKPAELDKMRETGELDLCVSYESQAGVGGEVLYYENIEWVGGKEETTLKNSTFPIALPAEGYDLRDHVISHLEKSLVTWEEVVSFDCITKIYDSVVAGQAIGAVPACLVDRAVTPVPVDFGFPDIEPIQLVAYKSPQMKNDETKQMLGLHVIEFIKNSKLSYLF